MRTATTIDIDATPVTVTTAPVGELVPTGPATPVAVPAAPAAPQAKAKRLETRKMKIGGDIVRQATVDLPPEQREQILWLYHYAFHKDISLKELSLEVGAYEQSVWHKVFHGNYEGNLENVTTAIVKFRQLSAARSTVQAVGFVMTPTARRVFSACDTALVTQRIVPIISEGAGLSTTLEEYARRHRGTASYVRMGMGGTLWELIQDLNEIHALPSSPLERELRRRLVKCFSPKDLLIVDDCESGFCALGTGMSPVRAMEFLRNLHEESGCAVILAGSTLFQEQLQRGKWAKELRKLRRRCLPTVTLRTTRADLQAIAESIGLPPITDQAQRIQEDLTRDGMDQWVNLLSSASRMAAKDGGRVSWDHVTRAYGLYLKLGGE